MNPNKEPQRWHLLDILEVSASLRPEQTSRLPETMATIILTLEKDEKKSWNKSKCYEKQQIGSKEFGIGVEGEETKDSIYLSIDKTRLHLRSLFLSEPQCQASLEWWSCGDDEDEDEDRTKTIWASFFIVTSTISLSSSLSLF